MDFLYYLGLNLLMAVLQPKPKLPKAKQYALNEIEFNTATEDRSQSCGFGTFNVFPNVVWYGDYRADPITKKVPVNIIKSVRQTIGYRYRFGMWYAVAAQPCDRLKQVMWGERSLWSGDLELSKTAATDLAINRSWKESEDDEIANGVNTTLRFFNQDSPDISAYTPIANSYATQMFGAGSYPAYPNTLHCMWLGPSAGVDGFAGIGSSIPPLRLTLYRLPDLRWAFPAEAVRAAVQPTLDATQDIEGDANPAYVILELLTTRIKGIGPQLNSHALDLDSFIAAGVRLKAEGMGVSFAWEVLRSVGEVVADLLKQIDATVEIDPRSGKLRLKLWRQEDASVCVFDDNNIEELTSEKLNNLTKTANEVELTFTDRTASWIDRSERLQNGANVKAAGKVITRELDFIAVSRPSVASLIMTRELRKFSGEVMQVSFTGVLPEGTIITPGDVFTYAPSHLARPKRMRATSVRYGAFAEANRVLMEATEDIFRDGVAGRISSITPNVPNTNNGGTPASFSNALTLIAPPALHRGGADVGLYAVRRPAGSNPSLYMQVGVKAGGGTSWAGSTAAANTDGYFYDAAARGTLTANLSANTNASVLTVQLPQEDADALRESGVFTNLYVFLTRSASNSYYNGWAEVAANFYERTGEGLDPQEHGEWVLAATCSLVGTTLTLTGVKRGLFHTIPRNFNAGHYAWVLPGYFVDSNPLKTKLLDKVVSYNPATGAKTLEQAWIGTELYTHFQAKGYGRGAVLDFDAAGNTSARSVYAMGSDSTAGHILSLAHQPLPFGRVSINGSTACLDSSAPATVLASEPQPGVFTATVNVAFQRRDLYAYAQHGYFEAYSQSESAEVACHYLLIGPTGTSTVQVVKTGGSFTVELPSVVRGQQYRLLLKPVRTQYRTVEEYPYSVPSGEYHGAAQSVYFVIA